MNTIDSIKAKLAQASGKGIEDFTDVEKKYLAQRISVMDDLFAGVNTSIGAVDDKVDAATFPDLTATESKLPTKFGSGESAKKMYEKIIAVSDCTESSGTYTIPRSILGTNCPVIYAEGFGSTGGGYVPLVAVAGTGGWTLEAATTFSGTMDYFLVRYLEAGANSLLSFTIGATTYAENDYLGPDESGTSGNSTTFTFAGTAPDAATSSPVAFYNETTKIGGENGSVTKSANTWTATTEWSPETAPDKVVLTDKAGTTYTINLSTTAPTTSEEETT